MKIRNGFVSNSSSSSFCILGKPFDYSDLETTFKDKDFSKLGNSLYEIGGNLVENTNLHSETGISEYYDNIIIGLDIDTIETKHADKTINQVKTEIAEEMSKAWNVEIKPSEISFYTDGGFDG